MKCAAARFVYGLSAVLLFVLAVGVFLAPTSATPPRTVVDVIRFQALNGIVALFPLAFAIFCWKRYRHFSKESEQTK
jgi:hypothetical protein